MVTKPSSASWLYHHKLLTAGQVLIFMGPLGEEENVCLLFWMDILYYNILPGLYGHFLSTPSYVLILYLSVRTIQCYVSLYLAEPVAWVFSFSGHLEVPSGKYFWFWLPNQEAFPCPLCSSSQWSLSHQVLPFPGAMVLGTSLSLKPWNVWSWIKFSWK